MSRINETTMTLLISGLVAVVTLAMSAKMITDIDSINKTAKMLLDSINDDDKL